MQNQKWNKHKMVSRDKTLALLGYRVGSWPWLALVWFLWAIGRKMFFMKDGE